MHIIKVSFVEKWPLMNPNDVAFILITYMVFTFKVGPHIMEKRQPFQIKTLLVIYNVFKIVNSATLGYKLLSYVIDNGFFPRTCKHDDNTLYTIAVLYWKYMATSILNLFDTVFLIIRKKDNLVTFHHVSFNILMLITAWSCLKYDPTDTWMCVTMMNCFTHTMIYVCDAMTSMGPAYAIHLWWKNYFKVTFLIQFVLVAAHVFTQALTSQCEIHTGSYYVGLLNLALYICMFLDIYNNRYDIAEIDFVSNKHYE